MSSHPYLPARIPERTPAASALVGSARVGEIGLWAVLGLAFGLRILVSFAVPDAHHPDEIFQAFEQAHRYAFGYGLRPWEFEIGLRSVLVPACLAPFLWLADALGGGPAAMLDLARIALAALSLLPVGMIYRAGLRRSPVHAWIGGVAAATWCELVYFSYRPLTEALAADFLLCALALSTYRDSDIRGAALIGIGACLGAALMLRVHFAPAVLVVALALKPWRVRARLAWLAAGAAGPLALFGFADWIAWGAPFWSPWTAIRVNVGQDVASSFGVSPAYGYLVLVAGIAGPIAPLLIVPLVLRARASLVWILAALAILASHSLIPHKEYRFVFVCTSILVVAAAFGSADLLTRWRVFARGGALRRGVLAGSLATVWILASLLAAATDQQRDAWTPYRAEGEAFRLLARQPDLCGILLDGTDWSTIPGYAALHRDVPIYQRWPLRPEATPPDSAYNYVLVPPAERGSRPGFETLGCFAHPRHPGMCVLRRAGSCSRPSGIAPLAAEPGLGRPFR